LEVPGFDEARRCSSGEHAAEDDRQGYEEPKMAIQEECHAPPLYKRDARNERDRNRAKPRGRSDAVRASDNPTRRFAAKLTIRSKQLLPASTQWLHLSGLFRQLA
jgi:hypothetical protein